LLNVINKRSPTRSDRLTPGRTGYRNAKVHQRPSIMRIGVVVKIDNPWQMPTRNRGHCCRVGRGNRAIKHVGRRRSAARPPNFQVILEMREQKAQTCLDFLRFCRRRVTRHQQNMRSP
jgi:hypothetical protein